ALREQARGAVRHGGPCVRRARLSVLAVLEACVSVCPGPALRRRPARTRAGVRFAEAAVTVCEAPHTEPGSRSGREQAARTRTALAPVPSHGRARRLGTAPSFPSFRAPAIRRPARPDASPRPPVRLLPELRARRLVRVRVVHVAQELQLGVEGAQRVLAE